MPELEELIRQHRRRLLKDERALVQDIRELYAGALDELLFRQARAVDLVERRIAAGDNPLSALITQRRTESLMDQLSDLINEVGAQAADRIEVDRRSAILATSRDFQDVAAEFEVRAGADEQALIRQGLALQANTPVSKLFAGQAARLAEQGRQELFTGIALGDNPNKIARRLRPYVVGARHRAETIARTEVLRTYRNTMRERMKANDAITEWVWISARDSRTCAMCWAMHGQRFPTSTPMATHPNCRCSQGPVPGFSLVEVRPGVDIFDDLDPIAQRAILGPAKFRAYQDGRIKLRDLVGYAEHPEWGPIRFERSLRSILQGPPPAPPRRRAPRVVKTPEPAPTPPPLTPPPPARQAYDGSAKTIKAIEQKMHELYPQTHFSFAALEVAAANRMAVRYSQLAEEWPAVAGALKFMGTNRNVPDHIRVMRVTGALAHVTRPNYGSPATTMSLNPSHLGKVAKAEAQSRSFHDSGWGPKMADPSHFEGVITHEFGHMVDFWLRGWQAQLAPAARVSGLGIVASTYDKWRAAHSPQKAPVSRYAKTNYEESFAEAFKAAYHGTPEVLASETVRHMRNLIDVMRTATPRPAEGNRWLSDITDQAERDAVNARLQQVADRLEIEFN